MLGSMEMVSRMKKKMKVRRYITFGIIAVIAVVGATFWLRSASFQRWWKTMGSEYGGGLDRTVTVYDNTGNVLRTYEGKFDIQESETKVFFDDENGRRVTIYNAIVITEENIE